MPKFLKDINAPRRPLTAYFQFCEAKRAQVAKKTGLNGFKAAPELGKMWKSLKKTQKARWIEPVEAAMQAYKTKFEAYKKTENYINFKKQRAMKKLGKRPKDVNAPKRPASAFFLFNKEHHAEESAKNPGLKMTEIGKKLGQMWANLSSSKKAKYEQLVQDNKSIYAREMKRYKEIAAHKDYLEKLAMWKNKKRAANGQKEKEIEKEKIRKDSIKKKKELEKEKKKALIKKKRENLKLKKLKAKALSTKREAIKKALRVKKIAREKALKKKTVKKKK